MSSIDFINNEVRVLGSGVNDKEPTDYTVLVMAFINLILLLLTEVMRRGLDRAARGRKIAETVLQVFYHELTSLGIVSATLYLIHNYAIHPLEEKTVKVFEEIHYVLFFVAAINAIQCCVLYYLAMKVAMKNWVRVESIDIDHYIAIRQRFVKICNELKENTSSSNRISSINLSILLNQGLFTTAKKNLYDFFHHPRLLFKYRQLLVQIRYHELRVKLIEAHKLPPKFRVSEYLIECLNHVFVSFIEISAVVWLSLLGVVNFLYFLCGIINYQTYTLSAAGSLLAFIYIFHPFVFLIITFFIYAKVKLVFRQIIASPTLTRHGSFRREGSFESTKIHETEKNQQLSLFWFGNPMLIVAAAQYMLFGSATFLSIWLVYKNDDLRQYFKDLKHPDTYFIVICLVGSVICIVFWSFVVPAYTLCTGLGALVDVDRLYESKAVYHLTSLRKERLHLNAKAKELRELRAQEELRKVRRRGKWKNRELTTSFHLERISDLVKSSNDDLEIERQKIHHDSLSLRRTVSEGVAVMRMMKTDDSLDLVKSTNNALEIERHRIHHNPSFLRKTVSEGVAFMRMMMSDESSEGNIVSRSIRTPPSEREVMRNTISYTKNHSSKSSGLERPNFHLTPTQTFTSYDENAIIDKNEKHVLEKISVPSLSPNHLCDQIIYILNSATYYIISGFLATSIAFFVVGLRIQLFLMNDNVLLDRSNSWEPKPEAAFWTEVSLLILFMIEGLISSVVYAKITSYRKFTYVSMSEFVLAGTCLVILLVSESYRCEMLKCTNQCPIFGKRICGGLGQLEPFTALIGLRAFTWLILRPILNKLKNYENIENGKGSDDTSKERKAREFCKNEGNMIDLWKKAVIVFPDIVERHGLFSSELLMAMLDIPSLPSSDALNHGIEAPFDSSIQEETSPRLFNSKSNDGIEVPIEALTNFDSFEESESPIADLDSVLIRVMRRCQQKLLPLLDEWVVADVVLTDNEIIWFDVSSQNSTNRFNLRLRRTHGGYGMRVSEVSRGRNVIGRLSMKDIKSVSIDHRLASRREDEMTEIPMMIDEASINISDSVFRKEFWEEALVTESSFLPTAKRWERVPYDGLVIQSNEGILVLRFLVDLLDGEQTISRSRISQDDNTRNELILNTREALIWRDTIAKKIGQTTNQASSGRAVIATLRKSLSMAPASRAFSS